MKIRIIAVLILSMAVTSAAFARPYQRHPKEREDCFAVKIGYFDSGEEEERTGAWDFDVEGAAAFGLEYYAITRKDVAVSISAFYSRPDIDGIVWDDANARWVAVDEDTTFWQLSVSYIRFPDPVKGELHTYEGAYYGAGVGYSRMKRDEIVIDDVTYDVGNIHERSLDLNLIGGYKWYSGFGVEAKWIVDEEAYTLMGTHWF
ncbi:MAG: hypothetical protein ABIH66_09515 [bacterium]